MEIHRLVRVFYDEGEIVSKFRVSGLLLVAGRAGPIRAPAAGNVVDRIGLPNNSL